MNGHARIVNKNNRSLQRKQSKAFFHKWETKWGNPSNYNSDKAPKTDYDPAKAARLLDKHKMQLAVQHTVVAIIVISIIGWTFYYVLF